MTAAHMHRAAPRRAGVPAGVPAEGPLPMYAPGHFLALVRLHDWPPRFAPQYRRTREVEQSELSRINREAQVAQGNTGTIVGLSQRADTLIRQRVVAHRAVR